MKHTCKLKDAGRLIIGFMSFSFGASILSGNYYYDQGYYLNRLVQEIFGIALANQLTGLGLLIVGVYFIFNSVVICLGKTE